MSLKYAAGALVPSELTQLVTHLWRASSAGRYCSVLVWGEAGIGKSQTVRDAARALGIGFKDLRLGLFEAPDLLGVPRQQEVFPCWFDHAEGGDLRSRGRRFTRAGLWNRIRDRYSSQVPRGLLNSPDEAVTWAIDEAKNRGLGSMFGIRTVNSPPGWLPQPATAGILFLDELNRSQKDIRQGSFQLLLDRRIGEYDLPARWIIVSAVNPPSSADESGAGGYEVAELSDAAFLSRFCHVALRPSLPEWLDFARKTRIDPRARVFLSHRGADALGGNRPTEIPDPTPKPRSWVILSGVIAPIPVAGASGAPTGAVHELDPKLVPAVAIGLVGIDATRMWIASKDVPDPPVTAADLVSDPEGSRRRLLKFLAYPNFASGAPILGADGNPVLSRRADLIRITFESCTDEFQKEYDERKELIRQQKEKEDGAKQGPREQLEALKAAHREELLASIDLDAVAARFALLLWTLPGEDQGGLGMRDMGMQYLKRWSTLAAHVMNPSLFSRPEFTSRGLTFEWFLARAREIAQLQGRVTTSTVKK